MIFVVRGTIIKPHTGFQYMGKPVKIIKGFLPDNPVKDS